MVKLKREVSASLFRCTHRNSIARSVPDISRMFPDYPGSFLIVITFSVTFPPQKTKRFYPLEHLTLEMLAYGRQKPAFSHFVARIFKKILAEQLAHFIR